MTDISIVVPVYNSERIIPRLAAAIDAHVSREHELILVNDGSVDGSWEAVRKEVRERPSVVGINLWKNSGQDIAILAGLSEARGRFVVIMDDDLQHSPEHVEALCEQCERGYDVCYASFDVLRQKAWKNLGSWINGKAARVMLGKPRELYLSPFKALTREVAKELVTYQGPYPYIDGLILSTTGSITRLPVPHCERAEGRSNYSPLKSLSVWANHLTGFSVMPLRAATLGGFVTAVTGFLLGVYFIIEYMVIDHHVEGWTSLVSILLFLGGVQLMALGIIGEYIGRTYLLLNRRERNVVKEVVGRKTGRILPAESPRAAV